MDPKSPTSVSRDTKQCPCCGGAFEELKLPHQDTCELRVQDRTRGHPMLRCSNNHQFSPCLWDSCCTGHKYWKWELTRAKNWESKKWKLQCPHCIHAARKDTVREIYKEGQTSFEFRVNKSHSWIPIIRDNKEHGNPTERTSQQTVRFRLKLSCGKDKVHAERKLGTQEIVYVTRVSDTVTRFKVGDPVVFFLCPRDPQAKRGKQSKDNSPVVDWQKNRFWLKTPLQGTIKRLLQDGKLCEVECKREIPRTYQDSPRFTFRHGECKRNVVRPYKRGPCMCCSKKKITSIPKHDVELYHKLNPALQMITGMHFWSLLAHLYAHSQFERTNTDSSLSQPTKKRSRKAQPTPEPETACKLLTRTWSDRARLS